MASRRALHFVFKIGDRKRSIDFLKDVLGMTVLRHEEFAEGCKAFCNGPYDGKWSKTMIGYGPEDNHFVLELTYNYGIGSYKMGNDFQYIQIDQPEAFSRLKSGSWPIISSSTECVETEMPGGYRFRIYNREPNGDPVKLVALSSSVLQRSIDYWSRKCGMQLLSSTDTEATLCFDPAQCHLKLVAINQLVDHASAFGRIAFACPKKQLLELQSLMDAEKETILKRLVSLDTPGKATVEVIILADPDGHEICFVGDEAFRQLSQMDPNADKLLLDAIQLDKSDDWFRKHGGKATQ
ncbi:glyoxalase family protein [Opisthorchis viverrini]|uniref:Glyoxalase family protein n=1 Tax=Opisthorchis viverrini TaxID=6198 RepID=A0A1S8X0V8_OPIVI|nr:glyoxalase family protein [Opisthorchis viverrini]